MQSRPGSRRRTYFFKCWNWKWSLASNQNTKELLDQAAIVNREDLPANLVPAVVR